MLNFITALAIGALVGDALIHIVPHAMETSEMLAAEAKGLADPHAGHGHRFLKDQSRFLEEDDHPKEEDLRKFHRFLQEEAKDRFLQEEEEEHDHSAGIRVGTWVCVGIFGQVFLEGLLHATGCAHSHGSGGGHDHDHGDPNVHAKKNVKQIPEL